MPVQRKGSQPNNRRSSAALLALLLVPCLAFAEPGVQFYTDQSDWYAGARIGWSNYADACAPDALACDREDTGFGLFAGWQPLSWFGAELSYNDLGEATASYAFPPGLELTGRIKTFDISARLRWRFGERWTIYGKAGAAYADFTTDAVVNELSEDDWKGLVAGGLGYDFNRNWQARLEYQYMNKVGDSQQGFTDTHFLTANFAYYFGGGKAKTTATEPVSQTVEDSTPMIVAPPPLPQPEEIPELKLNVLFAFDSAELQNPEIIDTMIMRLRDFPQANVEIRGYADNTGSPAYNIKLSFRRAKTVVLYLIDNGIERDRISFEGRGIDPTGEGEEPTPNNLARHRRVSLTSPAFTVMPEATRNTASAQRNNAT